MIDGINQTHISYIKVRVQVSSEFGHRIGRAWESKHQPSSPVCPFVVCKSCKVLPLPQRTRIRLNGEPRLISSGHTDAVWPTYVQLSIML
jgi:hypothetical protein